MCTCISRNNHYHSTKNINGTGANMLTKISLFIKSLSASSEESHEPISHEIACAVLLCEVMKADGLLEDSEQEKVAVLLTKKFSLTPIEIDDIISQALDLSENATDFYQFTSAINKHYSVEERINIVKMLWQLAYADGELASIEEHIIRKIADLLHLRHNEYIHTKISTRPPLNP